MIGPNPQRQQELLRRAELLVQPALQDRTPVASLQALSVGVPVVVSTECGLPQVEACAAGRVVVPNRAAIKRALKGLLTQPPERLAEMGANGARLIREHFDWGRLVPRYVELYRTLASGK